MHCFGETFTFLMAGARPTAPPFPLLALNIDKLSKATLLTGDRAFLLEPPGDRLLSMQQRPDS